MADANDMGEGWYLVRGHRRLLNDGSVYVVTDGGAVEDMEEVFRCGDCDYGREEPNLPEHVSCALTGTRHGRRGFCAWGSERRYGPWPEPESYAGPARSFLCEHVDELTIIFLVASLAYLFLVYEVPAVIAKVVG